MAELERTMREKARKASAYIQKTSGRAQVRPERAPICTVRVGTATCSADSRVESAPTVVSKPSAAALKAVTVTVSAPSVEADTVSKTPQKSALKRTVSVEKKKERNIDLVVKYVKASELPEAVTKTIGTKGKLKFISLETSPSSSGTQEKVTSSTAARPLADLRSKGTVVSGNAVSQLASAATQYLPPLLPPKLSQPMVKCMRHLAGEDLNLSIRIGQSL